MFSAIIRNITFWLKYAEMEMRHRFVNHARNVWDRAVTLLPRIDQLWYKYIHMEEMLGNMAGARQVFERWMAFEPDHQGWMAYIKASQTATAQCSGQDLLALALVGGVVNGLPPSFVLPALIPLV